LTLAAVVAGGLGSVFVETASALPLPGARRPARPAASRGFNLFAGAVDVWLNANRVQCNINNLGEQCVAPAGSTVAGGGFWPVGSPDQYVFNGGIQTAATIDPAAGFKWAGDTVATYFMDPRGDQTVGYGLTPVYNSLVPDDIANWPSPAFIRDTTLFDKALVGAPLGTAEAFRQTISQQDTWTRYWDGNVNIISGRPHPMGLLVDQRTLAWSFPTGNQDIIYFIMRFINVTSGDPADYAGLSKYGYTDADIADIVTLAQQYRAAVLDKFGVTITGSTATRSGTCTSARPRTRTRGTRAPTTRRRTCRSRWTGCTSRTSSRRTGCIPVTSSASRRSRRPPASRARSS